MPDGPIPAELWARLKRLDRRCDIAMRRDQQWYVRGTKQMLWTRVPEPGAPQRRAWCVRIQLRGSVQTYDIFDSSAPGLAEALEIAVLEGERRGWAKAAPAG